MPRFWMQSALLILLAALSGLITKTSFSVALAESAPLPAPDQLRAGGSADSITLTWRDNSVDESGFSIERSLPNADAWTEIATVGPDVTTYVDAGFECADHYSYRVRAFRLSDGLVSGYTLRDDGWTSPCRVPLLNPSFEDDADGNLVPDAWSAAGLFPVDGRDCTTALAGLCSLVLTGRGGQKTLWQSAPTTPKTEPMSLHLAYALRQENLGLKSGSGIELTLHYADGATEVLRDPWGMSGDCVWRGRSSTFPVSRPFTSLDVAIRFDGTSGRLWVDNLYIDYTSEPFFTVPGPAC